jgi:puromycin-sensitive aminopeptidase
VPLQVGTVNGKAWYTLLAGAAAPRSRSRLRGRAGGRSAYSVGFFRIQYDRASFDALAGKAARLPDPTRLKLLNDTWSQVSAGACRSTLPEAGGEIRDEPRLAVWEAILSNLALAGQAGARRAGTPAGPRFVAGFAKPKFDKLGWEPKAGESAEERQLRALLAGDPGARRRRARDRRGAQRFARYQADPASSARK